MSGEITAFVQAVDAVLYAAKRSGRARAQVVELDPLMKPRCESTVLSAAASAVNT